jgi:hypothetical protein
MRLKSNLSNSSYIHMRNLQLLILRLFSLQSFTYHIYICVSVCVFAYCNIDKGSHSISVEVDEVMSTSASLLDDALKGRLTSVFDRRKQQFMFNCW